MRTKATPMVLFNRVTATAHSPVYNVEPFEDIVIVVSTSVTPTANFQVKAGFCLNASKLNQEPDFTSTSDEDNLWSFLSYDRKDAGTLVDGNAGLSLPGGGVILTLNVKGIKFITGLMTITSGTATAVAYAY